MSTIAFANKLRAEIEADLTSIEQGILSGAKDWDEYRFMVGRRHGLKQALAALEDTTRKFDAQD
jgi:hypothetical protein